MATPTFIDVGLWDNDVAGHTSIDASLINLVAGNAVIVFTRYESNSTTVDITDTAGNTYIEVTPTHVQQGATGGRLTAHYCLDCIGNASNVITATFGATKSYITLSAEQWSGITTYIDHEIASASASATISGSGLSASDEGVLIAGVGIFNGQTISLAGDLTNSRGFIAGTPSQYSSDGDYIVPGAGTVTGAFTTGGSTSLALISILFDSVVAISSNVINSGFSPRAMKYIRNR